MLAPPLFDFSGGARLCISKKYHLPENGIAKKLLFLSFATLACCNYKATVYG
jgi:hypothetical protein